MRTMTSRKAFGFLLGCAVATACSGDDTSIADSDSGSTTAASTGTGAETTSPTTSTPGTSSTTGTPGEDTTTGDPPIETCSDDIQNQDETDVDCGGRACAPCDVGQSCMVGEDCVSGSCDGGLCRPPACDDGVKNGDETDVDCGGSCNPCGSNQNCVDNSDCASELCINDVCVSASCRDGVQNGTETDVDCGGPSCPGCAEGGACQENGDCATAYCDPDTNTCGTVECLVNADCSHLAGTCTVGQCNQQTNTCNAVPAFQGAACNDGDSCTNSTCNSGVCGGPQINCSFLNAECAVGVCEQGVGCVQQPQADGDFCNDGNVCTTNTVCSAGSCGGGQAVDCSYLTTGCQVGVCNQVNGSCQVQLSPNGTPCDDAFACSTNGTCTAGACVPDNLVPFWSEDFANNGAGWTLGTNWQIGPAMSSNCTTGNQDPGTDHTPTGDNGVAGVVIGGCAPQVVHDFYCITSPVIDTSVVDGPVLLEFWRQLISDYTPFMQNRLDVYDGAAWVNIWASGGSPMINDPNWTRIIHELSNFKHPTFQMRFCYNIGSTGVFNVASWNLDDVALLSCPQ